MINSIFYGLLLAFWIAAASTNPIPQLTIAELGAPNSQRGREGSILDPIAVLFRDNPLTDNKSPLLPFPARQNI
ncbi:hypothetical protein DFH28DRAFT_525242 [Melampsora americana]|nr:hypothetical protein DFH28DRAFT_525242 [Melampsora americana]